MKSGEKGCCPVQLVQQSIRTGSCSSKCQMSHVPSNTYGRHRLNLGFSECETYALPKTHAPSQSVIIQLNIKLCIHLSFNWPVT